MFSSQEQVSLMATIVSVLNFIFDRVSTGLDAILPQQQSGSNLIENIYQSQLKDLEMRISFLIIVLVLLCIIVVIIFLLYQKLWKSRRLLIQQNEEIVNQQRSNDEIMLILEQKKHEIEQQSYELHETSTELKWQTENALRLYDEVEQQKTEITDSIQYAKRIQTALLPEKAFINEILNDYFVLFQQIGRASCRERV